MRARKWLASTLLLTLTACAAPDKPAAPPPAIAPDHVAAADVAWLDRLSWGASASSAQELQRLGRDAWLQRQLQPPKNTPLPPAVQAQIDAMTITRTPMIELVRTMEMQRREANAIADDAQKQAAHQAYQQEMNRLEREAASRMLLRSLYSPDQLREQMTWFWFNHFNIHQHKHNLRAMVGDYEEQLRAHALGRFRDLLGASAFHPAMLLYLDNAQNASARINENYARELLELHTLGVDGGYTQRDVQELARVLTGLGVRVDDEPRRLKPGLRSYHVQRGLMEFNPARHDFSCSVRRFAARACPRSSRCWTGWPATRRPRASSAAGWRSISWPTRRRRRWSSAWHSASCRPTAASTRC